MPSTSIAQQRLFALVRQHQKGKLKKPTPQVKSIAKSISPEAADEFAKTKHKGLPKRAMDIPAMLMQIAQQEPSSVDDILLARFGITRDIPKEAAEEVAPNSAPPVDLFSQEALFALIQSGITAKLSSSYGNGSIFGSPGGTGGALGDLSKLREMTTQNPTAKMQAPAPQKPTLPSPAGGPPKNPIDQYGPIDMQGHTIDGNHGASVPKTVGQV